MNYPVTTSQQLRAVLIGMRKTRALSQAQVGQLLGVNQKRVARIESAPGVTSFDQIARFVARSAVACRRDAGCTPRQLPRW